MLSEYAGVLLMLGIAVFLTVGMLAVHLGLAPRRRTDPPPEVSEGGLPPAAEPTRRQAVRFYGIAMLFLVSLAGAVLFLPWAATFRQTGVPGLIAISTFALPLAVALFYEWSKGSFEW